MAGVNKVILIGNIGRDPEIKYTQSNVAVASFSLATSDSWKDKATGEWKEKTEWHKIVAWAGLAEQAGKLAKGQQVYVEGSLETRKYTGKDGTEKYSTEVKASRLLTLGKREGSGDQVHNDVSYQPPAADDGQDLPF